MSLNWKDKSSRSVYYLHDGHRISRQGSPKCPNSTQKHSGHFSETTLLMISAEYFVTGYDGENDPGLATADCCLLPDIF